MHFSNFWENEKKNCNVNVYVKKIYLLIVALMLGEAGTVLAVVQKMVDAVFYNLLIFIYHVIIIRFQTHLKV